ncbi:hypothetical protein [Serinicoccus sp. CNJ-927]|uniref:hypothetical protein n=1 Tax=Serinicoccus sp. CNJ-927 TaxID=1904970 RepID=UPI00096ACB9B|nr:hypothetical protein [Serinicoccus sp. CNJ-927]
MRALSRSATAAAHLRAPSTAAGPALHHQRSLARCDPHLLPGLHDPGPWHGYTPGHEALLQPFRTAQQPHAGQRVEAGDARAREPGDHLLRAAVRRG